MSQTKPTTDSTISRSSTSWLSHLMGAVAVIGIALSTFLTQHFYEIRGEASHFKSSCNFGSAMNCDVVAASSSSELFGGFPLSSFAAGCFLTLFVMSFFLRQRNWQREATRAVFGLSLVSTLVSAIYFWIMRVDLHTLCLYCLGVDLCVLMGLAISWALKPDFQIKKTLDGSQWKTFLGIGVACSFVMVFGLSAMDQSVGRPQTVQMAVDSIFNSRVVNLQLDDSSPSIGPKDAPITIVEFSDFQCPFCKVGALNVNTVLYRYPGKIRIVFKNYPLDQKCNPQFPQTMHPAACEAARVALCAHEQGQFEAAYETLFEKQSSLVDGRVASLLEPANLDTSRLSSCAESPHTALLISRDIEQGKTLEISGTPTFFVNGHRIDGVQPIAVWNQVIERLLKP